MTDHSQTPDMLQQLQSLSIEREAPAPEQTKRKLPWKSLVLAALLAGGAGAAYHYDLDAQAIWADTTAKAEGFLTATNDSTATAEQTVAVSNPAPQAAPVATPGPMLQEPAVIGSGYVIAEREMVLRPDIGGRIVELGFDTGTEFRKGDMLAQFSDAAAQADLAISRAQVSAAEADLNRTLASVAEARAAHERAETLAAKGSLPRAQAEQAGFALTRLEREADVARDAIRIAELNVAKQEQALSYYTIKAPFDGVIVERMVNVGEVVASGMNGGPGGGIAVLIDPNALSIEVDIAETNLARIEPGQIGTVTLDAYPNRKFEARVTTIAPKASIQKGTIAVRLTFTTPTSAVLANMAAKVTFEAPQITADLQLKGN